MLTISQTKLAKLAFWHLNRGRQNLRCLGGFALHARHEALLPKVADNKSRHKVFNILSFCLPIASANSIRCAVTLFHRNQNI